MDTKNNEFMKKLLATFKVEAGEHINNITSGLLQLEKETAADRQQSIVEAVFREAHSLKGAARSVNVTEIEKICQSLESAFSVLKNQKMSLSAELLDILHRAADNLNELLPGIDRERTADEKQKATATSKALNNISSGMPIPTQQPEPAREEAREPPKPLEIPLAETVRISVRRLESLLMQTEELLSIKQAAGHLVNELLEFHNGLTEWEKEWRRYDPQLKALRNSLGKKDGSGQDKTISGMVQLLEFLDWNRSYIGSLEGKFTAITGIAERDSRALSGAVDNMLQDMRKASMLPFSSLLEVFPKLVRDLSRDQGKDTELLIQGQEIEIDRRILEEMKDPFIHLVRNCIDHGIEKPEERRQKGKSLRGKVTINISQTNSSSIDVFVSDDGMGINLAKVRDMAVKRGIMSQPEAVGLDEPGVLSLIFLSGVSTSPIVTDVSGRGLGLAIVKEKVERLGGSVSVETHPDAGTSFHLNLSVTLATFQGILVRAGEGIFVLPTANVERVLRVNNEDIETVGNKASIKFDGQVISLVSLTDVLELPRKNSSENSLSIRPVLILTAVQKRIAFAVDEIIEEQQVLVKNLGKQLSRVRNVLGGTILSTGKVVPVLNVNDLIKSAVKAGTPSTKIAAEKQPAEKQRSILVVEDSITARTLLKNILETAGYNIKTAVDGVDATTILKTEEIDLVVSDVDMPRMNGFDLTSQIRADKKLAELPVILVTALESREHRERGIEVGANAYIVKSSFDQSNLLDVIRRLI